MVVSAARLRSPVPSPNCSILADSLFLCHAYIKELGKIWTGAGQQGVPVGRSAMISGRGGTNGKPVWSGPAFEEGTRTSTEGSRPYGCGTCGFGKLEVRPA